MKDYGIFLNKETSQQVGKLLKGYVQSQCLCKVKSLNYEKLFNLTTSQQPFEGSFTFYTKGGKFVGNITQTENGLLKEVIRV